MKKKKKRKKKGGQENTKILPKYQEKRKALDAFNISLYMNFALTNLYVLGICRLKMTLVL